MDCGWGNQWVILIKQVLIDYSFQRFNFAAHERLQSKKSSNNASYPRF
jgi:hypothetical protein